MVNAQTWLDNNYPTRQRNTIKKLNIMRNDLEGELDLSGFVNLEELNCESNNLSGCLNLSNLSELKILNCRNNKIEELKIENCHNITYLEASGNRNLNKIDLSHLTSELVTFISFAYGNLPLMDLSVFSRFINLETLSIGAGNNFCGSLESLKNLSKLKNLHIEGTNIDSGLEHLPASVKNVHINSASFPNPNNPNPRVVEIQRQLESKNQTDSLQTNPTNLETNLEDKLKEIVNKFSQERLEKVPVDLVLGKKDDANFSNDNINVVAYTNWNDFNRKQSAGFFIKIRTDRDRMKVFRTLAHELAHDAVMLKEDKGKLHTGQGHSKTFWEDYLDWDSTLDFVLNNLDSKDREELAKLSNPSTNGIKDEEKSLTVAYFPIRVKGKAWENMTYIAKVVHSPITVDREWELTRRETLGLADKEMNDLPPERAKYKWDLLSLDNEKDEAKRRWLQIELKSKGEKDDEGEKDKYKIYVYYDKESPIREQLKSELCDRRGFKEKKNTLNLQKRMKLDESIDNNLIVICGYKSQVETELLQSQIQIPPK